MTLAGKDVKESLRTEVSLCMYLYKLSGCHFDFENAVYEIHVLVFFVHFSKHFSRLKSCLKLKIIPQKKIGSSKFIYFPYSSQVLLRYLPLRNGLGWGRHRNPSPVVAVCHCHRLSCRTWCHDFSTKIPPLRTVTTYGTAATVQQENKNLQLEHNRHSIIKFWTSSYISKSTFTVWFDDQPSKTEGNSQYV